MVSNISEEEFKALTGKSIPYDGYGNDLTLDDTPAQIYYAKSSIARFVWKRLSRKIKKKEASGR